MKTYRHTRKENAPLESMYTSSCTQADRFLRDIFRFTAISTIGDIELRRWRSSGSHPAASAFSAQRKAPTRRAVHAA